MRKVCLLLTMVAFLLSLAGQAAATIITYVDYTTATGSFNGEDFTNAYVQLSWTGNTDNVTGGPPLWTNAAAPGTVLVTIPTLGIGLLTDSISVYDQQNAPVAAGFVDTTLGHTILATFNTAFASYDLKSNIAKSGDSFVSPGVTFPTTGGDLMISSAGSSTFIATTAVPEPSTMIMLGTGLLAAAGVVRRRFL